MPVLSSRTIGRLGRIALSFGGVVSCLLLCSPASVADYVPLDSGRVSHASPTSEHTRAYTPPADLRPPTEDHTGAGTRSCGEVAAIAPRLNTVGQTGSPHPTFVWYSFCRRHQPVEFQLYRFAADGALEAIAVQQFATSQPGFMAYELSPAVATLTVGETYLWKVVLYHDENMAYPAWESSAEIEVVELPTDLDLAAAETAIAQARAYGEAGLWYDAIAAVYQADTPAALALRQALLLDLADLEAQANSPVELDKQLRQIAELEN